MGTILAAVLLVWNLAVDIVSIARGLIPAAGLVAELIYAFAAVNDRNLLLHIPEAPSLNFPSERAARAHRSRCAERYDVHCGARGNASYRIAMSSFSSERALTEAELADLGEFLKACNSGAQPIEHVTAVWTEIGHYCDSPALG